MKSLLALLLCLCSSFAFAAVSKKPSSGNSLGAVISFDNPNTYKVGSVVAMAYVGDSQGIVIRIQPLSTFALFTEDIFFCNVPVDKFNNKKNPLVLTYETVAHRSVEGIGCHELRRVDEVKDKENLP